jgi:hypothetical protein
MTIVAKPVIDKQFWILQQGDRKVGNVEACAGGYQVKINNQVVQYKTIKMVEQRVNIHFETAPKSTKTKTKITSVHGYPATGRIYNPMWDLQQKLPIYTKTNKSKSWFAAGWYRVKKGRNWATVQDPKLIVVQRYPYQGPFFTREEADNNELVFTKVC